MKKRDNPLSAYAVASQLTFAILTPLLIFIVGGYFMTERFDLPDWVMAVCVVLGIVFMLGSGISYLGKLIHIYGKDNKEAPKSYNASDENDYYYDD